MTGGSMPSLEELTRAVEAVVAFGDKKPSPTGERKPAKIETLGDHLTELRRRALTADLATDGFPASTMGGGRSSNDPANLNSVEAAANAAAFPGTGEGEDHTGLLELDAVWLAAENGIRHLFDAVKSLALAQRIVDKALKETTYQKPVAHQADPDCAEFYCTDPAPSGNSRHGRCPACAQWRDRHAYADGSFPVVPRDVIEARVEAREKKRQRVNPMEKAS